MSVRNLLIVAAGVCALLYFWPSTLTKAAKKIGDTTISAVKSGYEEAKK